MKKLLFVLLVVIIPLLLPHSVKSQTITIPRATFEKSKQAADELVVARQLIASQDKFILELQANNSLLVKQNSLIEAISTKLTEQSALQTSTIVSLTKERDIYIAKSEKLERSNKRWKQVAKVLGSVALGSIAILVGR